MVTLKLIELREDELAHVISLYTKNVALNYVKHQNVVNKHSKILPDMTEISLPDPAPSLDDTIELMEMESALNKVWDKLGEEEQFLLRGKYILRMTDAELADKCGCKAASIRMKLTRARRSAQELILNELNGDINDKS